MGWQYRTSFKVLPGIRLNLSGRGLSATLGAAPFSLNVGPRGVYSNLSIPGTGLRNRQRLDRPHSAHRIPSVPPEGSFPGHDIGASSPLPLASPDPTVEVRSASTELLNSAGLEDVRRLMREAYDERATLGQEIDTAKLEADEAGDRYNRWKRGFVLKRLRPKQFALRKESSETASEKLTELREQLQLTHLALQIEIDREQAEPFYRMRDAFAALGECQRIWDTLARRAINRAATRSAADEAITRQRVSFQLGGCDLVSWDQKIPHLQNANGGDLFLYPGFVLYRSSRQAFALIESRDVAVDFSPVHFIEDGGIPSDSTTVGQVWAKANKDGSPDRRFNGNYQIPLVLYGKLVFSSPTGLEEEYQISNAARAEQFALAWNTFCQSVSLDSARQTG